jgi:hypothetical protein
MNLVHLDKQCLMPAADQLCPALLSPRFSPLLDCPLWTPTHFDAVLRPVHFSRLVSFVKTGIAGATHRSKQSSRRMPDMA